jgi:hypothetical protein
MTKTPLQELLDWEANLSQMFDSDQRIAMAVLERIRTNRKEMIDEEERNIGYFLNWFIRHYSTEITTDRGLLYYANAMGEEVSIAEILEHYNREK